MPTAAGPRLSSRSTWPASSARSSCGGRCTSRRRAGVGGDPEVRFILDRGTEVGELARTYVPGGVLIDVPHEEPERRLRETAEALRAGAKVLYEATIEHDGVMVLPDILEQGPGSRSGEPSFKDARRGG